MPRSLAELPKGARITDFISLGVLAEKFPVQRIHKILKETGRESERQRNLPAHVVVYYVIALALYMEASYGEVLRCLVEGLDWLGINVKRIRRTAKSAISQARKRLGVEPLKRLYAEVVGPIARRETKGAWYKQWRLVTVDGSTLDLGDTRENEAEFGRPGASRGRSGFPQLRFVSLVESGTHVLFGAEAGSYATGESTLAHKVLDQLKEGMLCIADRNFYSYKLWKQAQKTGADLLWRVKKNMNLPCLKRLPDGSYLSSIYPSDKARRHQRKGIPVRVIEYRLVGAEEAEPMYRLITTILEENQAPAQELAALYHERWEIENALDELKTHLRGARIVLRSKKPELVRQEFYGLLLAHFAVRGLMHEAALEGDVDPDDLSFVHSIRVVRRKLPVFVSIPPSGEKEVS
ncbi:IS4 family transposase [Acidobacteria bacterium AH-259-L09]|nr:IS4 family transposase [Acidobacteria bacterium AH-259-L09]